MDWSESPTTISSAGSTVEAPVADKVVSPQSSRISAYWAWLVSWYSSTST